MSFDFPWILTTLTLICVAIWLVDRLFFAKKRAQANEREPLIVEYAVSFLPVFIIVLVIRTFIVQIYTVPTGSLEPTVMPGDYILANEFQYGLKLPVWRTTIIPTSKPKRGEIALVHWPVNPDVIFVKRVIGVPGDHISYQNKVLYINGKKMPQKLLKTMTVTDDDGVTPVNVNLIQENLNGVVHNIYTRPDVTPMNFKDYVVPQGYYFLMGDNRDNSDDSRYWGPVPARDLVGKAFLSLFNKKPGGWQFSFSRSGKVL